MCHQNLSPIPFIIIIVFNYVNKAQMKSPSPGFEQYRAGLPLSRIPELTDTSAFLFSESQTRIYDPLGWDEIKWNNSIKITYVKCQIQL